MVGLPCVVRGLSISTGVGEGRLLCIPWYVLFRYTQGYHRLVVTSFRGESPTFAFVSAWPAGSESVMVVMSGFCEGQVTVIADETLGRWW